MAARLIARTGRIGRFQTAAVYANYCGTAPIEVASADKARHRLSRKGDRQLNSALHTIAVIQIRMPASPGRAYYDRKVAEGKSAREAKRCLKRRLADHIWRHDRRRTSHSTSGGSGWTRGGDSHIQRGRLNSDSRLFGQVTTRIRHHQAYDPRRLTD
nr:transposase [Streptomyces sp.]